MPSALQVRLLRVLQEQRIRPVGAGEPVDVDVRIISATRRDLEAAMERGDFREDLYYRLNVVSLQLPSRNAARILPARQSLPARTRGRCGKDLRGFADDALERLISAPWPGNVRQLYNAIRAGGHPLHRIHYPRRTCPQGATRRHPGPSRVCRRATGLRARLPGQAPADHPGQCHTGRTPGPAQPATEFYKLLNRHELNPGMFKAGR
ncbi:MAG: sigma 54-interacting transcriptional regulator [Arhodomonas sp.]|nr:sigma 54-interacting transcriptional regulator [Arhodomonas sp.]